MTRWVDILEFHDNIVRAIFEVCKAYPLQASMTCASSFLFLKRFWKLSRCSIRKLPRPDRVHIHSALSGVRDSTTCLELHPRLWTRLHGKQGFESASASRSLRSESWTCLHPCLSRLKRSTATDGRYNVKVFLWYKFIARYSQTV